MVPWLKNNTSRVKSMEETLKRGKIWKKRKDNGRHESICNTTDMGAYIKKIQNDANVPDMNTLRKNTCIVLYKQTSCIFPVKNGISCKDWTEIIASVPTAVPTDTNTIITNTGNMATNIAELAQPTIEE